MGELFEGLKRHIVITSIIIFIVAFYIHYNYFPYERHIDTYECYVTPQGECYHDIECRYLGKNVIKTTVYEAQDEYRKCKYCDVADNGWGTTIIVEERTTGRSLIMAIIITLSAYFIIDAFATSRIGE